MEDSKKCKHEKTSASTIRHESGVSLTKVRCQSCGQVTKTY